MQRLQHMRDFAGKVPAGASAMLAQLADRDSRHPPHRQVGRDIPESRQPMFGNGLGDELPQAVIPCHGAPPWAPWGADHTAPPPAPAISRSRCIRIWAASAGLLAL